MKISSILSAEGLEVLRSFQPDAERMIDEKVRPLAPELVDRLVSVIYDDLYRRDILTRRERHIATMSALIAMGDTRPQLRFQLRAAFQMGFTRIEIEELLIQNSIFAGFSRSMNAAEVLSDVHEAFLRESNEKSIK